MDGGPEVCAGSASERASCFRFSVIALIPNPLAPSANVGEGSAFPFSQCRGRGPSRASCFRFSARTSPPRLIASRFSVVGVYGRCGGRAGRRFAWVRLRSRPAKANPMPDQPILGRVEWPTPGSCPVIRVDSMGRRNTGPKSPYRGLNS